MIKEEVSIFFLCYNQEKFVENALRSVLGQVTSFIFHIHVLDDSSTDQTVEILRKLQKANSETITLHISSMNSGQKNSTMNTLHLLKGKYIALIEGDDEWLDSHKLQRQYDLLEKNQALFLSTHDAVNTDEEGNTIDLYSERYSIPSVSGFSEVLEKNRWPTSSFFFRNQIDLNFLKKHTTSKYNGDWVLALYCSLNGGISFNKKIRSKRVIRKKGQNQQIGGDTYLKFQINTLLKLKNTYIGTENQHDIAFALAGRYLKLFDFYRERGSVYPIYYLGFIRHFKPFKINKLKFVFHTIKKPINAFLFKTYYENYLEQT